MQRRTIVLGTVGGVLLLILLPLVFAGLGRVITGGAKKIGGTGRATFAIWTLGDGREVFDPVVQAFLEDHKDLTVEYRRYTDPIEYRNLLIDQIAEGKGPDIAAFPNEWVAKDRFKFQPYPSGTNDITPETFAEMFVGSANDDLVLPDQGGKKQIYGLPVFTDNLALYYNKRIFRDYVLGSNQPNAAWNGNQQDDLFHQAIKITRPDLSLEQFLIAGIALGRADNIRYGLDAFFLFLLQHGAQITDAAQKSSTLVTQRSTSNLSGPPPFVEALRFFTSFAVSDFQQYSWNAALTQREFDELELGAFATGKVAMFYGYSDDYPKILNSVKGKTAVGRAAITADDIGIIAVPQLSVSSTTRSTFARYYPLMVPVTSQRPKEAWDLITRLVDPEYQQNAFTKHHKISSLTSLLEKQSLDPVYGVFASQANYARTVRLADPGKIRRIFTDAITDVVAGGLSPNAAAVKATTKLQCVLDQINRVVGREGMNCLEGK